MSKSMGVRFVPIREYGNDPLFSGEIGAVERYRFMVLPRGRRVKGLYSRNMRRQRKAQRQWQKRVDAATRACYPGANHG